MKELIIRKFIMLKSYLYNYKNNIGKVNYNIILKNINVIKNIFNIIFLI